MKTQFCSRCLLDNTDTKFIDFDKAGVCNYCLSYDEQLAVLGPLSQRGNWLASKVEEIKKKGKNKPYDCILGISGGLDSSYMALWAKKVGLRPLLVHMDNGWNNELAVQNIASICEILNFDLNTEVLNWEEFKDLQLAYLRASVIDIEVLTDHAIAATIYKLAQKYDITYTLNGFNLATEAVMPRGWTYKKQDFSNIKDIALKYGGITTFKSFPHLQFWKKIYYDRFLNLDSIYVLNYMDYNKDRAKEELMKSVNWRDYGGKHHESMFTKFYQNYILPKKFGVDKRKAHLSNLICSGMLNKQEALKILQEPLYDPIEESRDEEFVLKKLGLTSNEFSEIMKLPVRSHLDFKTEDHLWELYFKIIGFFKMKRSKN